MVRASMGVGAALIFPATLSIISNLYTGRTERAKAIGAGLSAARAQYCSLVIEQISVEP